MESAAPTPDTDRRSFRAGDLDIELELPFDTPRRLVVLVPGLFATAAFFRVDPDTGPSVARWLVARSCALVHFDQRGVGRNRARARARGPIDLSSRVEDLQMVVDAAHALLPDLPLVLFGHSFGGTAVYALTASGRIQPNALVTIGSPARLVPRGPPWQKLFSRETEVLAQRLTKDGWLDALSFAYIQNRIYCGRGHWPWLPKPALALGQWAVARWRWLAESTLAQPRVASFLYRSAPAPADCDYTPTELQRVLRAGTIEREYLGLLMQLLAFGRTGTGIALRDRASLTAASAKSNVPVLAAYSEHDELVLRDEVQAWASPTATFLDVGACGHGGYFFKPAPRRVLLEAIDDFLHRHAT